MRLHSRSKDTWSFQLVTADYRVRVWWHVVRIFYPSRAFFGSNNFHNRYIYTSVTITPILYRTANANAVPGEAGSAYVLFQDAYWLWEDGTYGKQYFLAERARCTGFRSTKSTYNSIMNIWPSITFGSSINSLPIMSQFFQMMQSALQSNTKGLLNVWN